MDFVISVFKSSDISTFSLYPFFFPQCDGGRFLPLGGVVGSGGGVQKHTLVLAGLV